MSWQRKKNSRKEKCVHFLSCFWAQMPLAVCRWLTVHICSLSAQPRPSYKNPVKWPKNLCRNSPKNLQYIDLARAKSEALVNNTCKQKKLDHVKLNGKDNENGFKTNRSCANVQEEIMHGRVVPHEDGACLVNVNNERVSEWQACTDSSCGFWWSPCMIALQLDFWSNKRIL